MLAVQAAAAKDARMSSRSGDCDARSRDARPIYSFPFFEVL